MALYTIYEFMKKVKVTDISLIADMETKGFLSPANQTAAGTRYYNKQQVKNFDYLYSLYVDYCRKQAHKTAVENDVLPEVIIEGNNLKPLTEDFEQTKQDNSYSFTVNVVDATCTSKGYTEHICNENKFKSYKDNIVPPLGHDYVKKTIEPTCLNAGAIEHSCSRCGHSYSDSIPAIGHKFQITEQVEASCEVEGYITYQCEHCNEIKKETFPALTHKFEDTVTDEGDCTHQKVIESKCSVCGKVELKHIEPLGHSFEIEEIPATCEKEGIKQQTCTKCGFAEILDRFSAKGHSFVETIDFEPTTTLTGQKTLTCSVCNKKKTEIIPCLAPKNISANSMLDKLMGFKKENAEVLEAQEEQVKQYAQDIPVDDTPMPVLGKKRRF